MKTNYPFRNPQLDLEERIDDLIQRLTLREKLGFIPTKQDGVERLGIKPYNVEAEVAHGFVMRDGSPTTVFPQTLGLGCTWNSELLQEIGNVAAAEARAYYQLQDEEMGLTLWAPTVDLERDPRWGRTEEAYGEDPYLTSTLATSFVKGLQGDHPYYLKTAATLKHFFANNNEYERTRCSVSVDPRNMQEYYWQAFKPIVENGKVSCVMTAYNGINGVPAILNKDVKNVLKDEWGLPGFVVGDAKDFVQTVTHHQYYNNHAESIADTLKSGVDCLPDDPQLVIESLEEALERGLLGEVDLDRALRNIFRIRFRLGQFDPKGHHPYSDVDPQVIDSDHHRAVALQAQQESIVLLKNEDSLLPLAADKLKKVAVIGPLADQVYMDWYAGYASQQTAILDGIKAKLSHAEVSFANGLDQIGIKSVRLNKYLVPNEQGVLTAKGASLTQNGMYEHTDWGWGRSTLKAEANQKFVSATNKIGATKDEVYGWFVRELFDFQKSNQVDNQYQLKTWDYQDVVINNDGELIPATGSAVEPELFEVEVKENGIAAAVELARSSDIAIVCLGNHPLINGKEENDRADIQLPESQQKLIKAVYAANPNTVLVLVASYPVAINWENQHIPAIVYTTNCSQELGTGVADVLFGDYNPAGRLNMTWYRSVSQLPNIMDYDVIKGGRTYLYHEHQSLYPFGYGLSYTKFEYQNLKLKADRIAEDQSIEFSFNVTNTGKLAGDEVVQVYLTANQPSVKRPLKQLYRFNRIKLQPGENQVVKFTIPAAELGFYDVSRDKFCVETGFYTVYIGRSSADQALAAVVWVEGEEIPPRDLTKKTRAANYDDYSGVYLAECKEGGTAIRLQSNDGWLAFKNVLLPAEFKGIEVRVASPVTGGRIELYVDGLEGELLGTYDVLPTGNLQRWTTMNFVAKHVSGIRDLYLRITGDVSLAWFQLFL